MSNNIVTGAGARFLKGHIEHPKVEKTLLRELVEIADKAFNEIDGEAEIPLELMELLFKIKEIKQYLEKEK